MTQGFMKARATKSTKMGFSGSQYFIFKNFRAKIHIFRQWAPARWASRMRVTEEFPLDSDGRLSVKKSGLYYIYAQVNYLDEHDVNAFQVRLNNTLKSSRNCSS